MTRHNIVLRKPGATSLNTITACNREGVSIFWENLRCFSQFPPQRIFNCDESGFSTVQRLNKIFAKRGQKRVGFATIWENGKTTTVLCCFSVSGIYVHVLFIFVRKRMSPQLQRNGPPGTIYEYSDNGWISEVVFLVWLNHFQSFVKLSGTFGSGQPCDPLYASSLQFLWK